MSAHEKHNSTNGGYETQDVSPRPAAEFTLMLILLMVFAMALMWGLFRYLDSRHQAAQPPEHPMAEALPAELPEPRLQPNPPADLQAIRREEQEQLTSYGWVDRQNGVARIPVQRAMEILTAKGLPTRAGSQEARK